MGGERREPGGRRIKETRLDHLGPAWVGSGSLGGFLGGSGLRSLLGGGRGGHVDLDVEDVTV